MKKLLFLALVILAFASGCQKAEEKPKTEEAPVTEEVVLEDELTALNDEWNIFRSETKQYSLNVPKETKVWDCDGKEVVEAVTVLTSEEFDVVVPENSYVTDETGKCEKVLTSTENLDSDAWKIFVANAETDADLDKFVKERFGNACSYKGKTADGEMYNVDINTTGPEVAEEEMCWINWITNVKFDPAMKKVAKFDIGQDANFYDKDGNPLDGEMAESFKFESNQ